MFLVKTIILCSGIFVLVESKSYGKNWFPKKYSHSIHKRVDPNYWEDLTLENNLLPYQPSFKNKFTNSLKNIESIHGRPWFHGKKHLVFFDSNSSPQMILKRFKRNDNVNFKVADQKLKKSFKNLQKHEKSINKSRKYEKTKVPSMAKKMYPFSVSKT